MYPKREKGKATSYPAKTLVSPMMKIIQMYMECLISYIDQKYLDGIFKNKVPFQFAMRKITEQCGLVEEAEK